MEKTNAKKKVLIIGGASHDVSCVVREDILPADSNPAEIFYSYGGVARNIAENLGRLGVKLSFITAHDETVHSQRLIEHLEGFGIDCSKSRQVEGKKAPAYISILDKDRELYVAVSDFSILDYLDFEYLKGLERYIADFDLVFIDGNLSEDGIDFITSINGIDVYVDGVSCPKVIKFRKYLDRIGLLKLNTLELEALLDLKIEGDEDLLSAMDMLLQRGVKRCFVTLGKRGAIVSSADGKYMVKGRKIDVSNITGAGDSFSAACVFASLWGLDDKHSLGMASAASEIALSSINAVSENMTAENLWELYRKSYEDDSNYEKL